MDDRANRATIGWRQKESVLTSPQPPDRLAPAVARAIRGALRRAGASLAFERIWPGVLPALVVVALFLIVSWLGLWLVLPGYARIAAVVLFALLLAASLWPITNIRLPVHRDARSRVERLSALEHHPITALEDRLAGQSSDEATRRLWEAHRHRSVDGIGRLTAGLPEPRVAARDPYALRAAVLLVLIVALFWAGPDWAGRIGSAFAPLERAEATVARIDAWVSPPNYTRRPPLLLSGRDERPGGPEMATADDRAGPIAVAAGSVLVVRAAHEAELEVAVRGADGTETPVADEANQISGGATEYTIELDADADFAVHSGGRTAFEWSFRVVPDQPPSIAFQRQPEATSSRALRLSYSVEDDYGVVSAEARFEALDEDLRALDNAPLIEPPNFGLTLPQARARRGDAQTIRDLTSHPWAGAQVSAHLVARDDLGQEGVSEAVEFTLPERRFREPMARALVEQRRELAIDRGARDKVALALDALTTAPDRFGIDRPVYLGIRSAYWRLRHGHGDEALVSVVDQLWDIALRIEDGDLSVAAEDLRSAQERLMQALEDGASDEELERLMAELRDAINRFLQEMARRSMSEEDFARMPIDPDSQMLSQSDLDRLLDAIEDMARSGAADQAREMLSQLRDMLENLQAGRMPEGMDSGPMNEMLDELADMIRRQQELMDQTFEFDQNMQDGERGEGADQQLGELGEGQQALREALEALMERLAELGADPGSELGEAGEAMGEAEGALGEGETGEALGQQGRALENLRRGGQALADQMMQQGEGYAEGQPGQSRQRTDPFGRPLRTEGPDEGRSVEVPDEIDAQRARRILEELRNRLSDPNRPRVELDYLERLLERFGR